MRTAGKFQHYLYRKPSDTKKLALKSAVIIVTGNEPFENISDEELENLKFLNDCGLHTYITLSDSTYRSFVQKGFRPRIPSFRLTSL